MHILDENGHTVFTCLVEYPRYPMIFIVVHSARCNIQDAFRMHNVKSLGNVKLTKRTKCIVSDRNIFMSYFDLSFEIRQIA